MTNARPSAGAWSPPPGHYAGRPPSYCRWSVGDWLNEAEDHRGYVPEDRYDAALTILAAGGVRVTRADLYLCAHVARMVEPEWRRPGLSWSHHRQVVTLPLGRQEELLELAEREELTCTALGEVVRGEA